MSDTLVVRGHKFRRVHHGLNQYQLWVEGMRIVLRARNQILTEAPRWVASADYNTDSGCANPWEAGSSGFETPEEALDFVISAVESHGNTFLRIAAKIRGAQ